MSKQLKSCVRKLEKSDSGWNRAEDRQYDDDDEVECQRKLQSSKIKRRQKVHNVEKSTERRYDRGRTNQRKRRHRSDDENADSRGSRRSDRSVVTERSRRDEDEVGDRQQRTDDRRRINGTSRHIVEDEHHRDSESEKKNEEAEDENYMKAKRAKVEDSLTTRTGGAYIPPARLKMMQVSSVQ